MGKRSSLREASKKLKAAADILIAHEGNESRLVEAIQLAQNSAGLVETVANELSQEDGIVDALETLERVVWLQGRVIAWLSAARLASMTSPREDDEPWNKDDWVLTVYGAHMTVLSLGHVERCLRNLRVLTGRLGRTFPRAVDEASLAFHAEFASSKVKEARDIMEHEEDRVSGLNLGARHQPYRHRGGMADPGQTLFGTETDAFRGIYLLREPYTVRPCIDLALLIAQPMVEWWAETSRELGSRWKATGDSRVTIDPPKT